VAAKPQVAKKLRLVAVSEVSKALLVVHLL
jgi:hypothetical protein